MRLEVELMRELESAYAADIAPAPVEHAAPYQWANACHDLFEAGRIDILEHSARHLHNIYPELTYLATMVALLDAMPRDLPPPLAFCNDPSAEIQVVRRPDCNKVLLCFCAAKGTLGLPINFIHQWLGRLPASLVYIKDFRNLSGGGGFPTLGPDRDATLVAFRRIARRLGRADIYTFGVSLGGYAALYYGLKLQAVSILSLAGATDYTPEFVDSLEPVPPTLLKIREQVPDYTRNLRKICASQPGTRVLLAYGSGHPRDRAHAMRMAGLPNVELVGVDYAQHNVVDPLIRQREFMPLLYRLMADPADRADDG